MNVYVLPEFFSLAECKSAIDLFPSPQPAEIKTATGTEVRERLRRGKASLLHDACGGIKLVERTVDLILLVNDRLHHFEIDHVETLQLAEYGVGDEYGWHLDIGPGSASLRKLSASVQLSDPGDYDGGDLEIWGSPPVDRSRGAIIIFPSYLPHRVTPVTRGKRRSLVAWSIGTKPFR